MGDSAGDSGTPYGTVIGDAHASVGLADAVVGLIHRPVSSWWSQRKSRRDMLEKLGEWSQEAVNKEGRFLQPVLTAQAFNAHLWQHDCCPQPKGSCSSTLAWAQLLHALGINPGNGAVIWNLPTTASEATEETMQTDTVLEVEGEAMRHIINLYRKYVS